jgi:hypothetical protein
VEFVVLDIDTASLLHRRRLPGLHACHLISKRLATTFVTEGEFEK